MDTSKLPGWVQDQIAVREAEDMAARRKAYDDWARHYAYMGSSDPDARCPCTQCNPGTVAWWIPLSTRRITRACRDTT